MDKRQKQKMEYELECKIRRNHIPVVLHKNFSSLKIYDAIKKNERKVNWKNYPELKIPRNPDFDVNWVDKADVCAVSKLGPELVKGISEKDMEKFYVSVMVNTPVVTCHIKKVENFKTKFGTAHYLNNNKVYVKDKLLVVSNHALERISERAFKESYLKNEFTKYILKWRCMELMFIADLYDNNMLEVFIPYGFDQQNESEKTKYWKAGYFVVDEMEDCFFAKTFEPPGYCGTPEEFLINKPWVECSFEEKEKVHETCKQAIETPRVKRNEDSLSDFICITPAWRKHLMKDLGFG